MLIQYCPNCPGMPYTKSREFDHCPTCGSTLASELLSEAALKGRPVLLEDTELQTFGYCASDVIYSTASTSFEKQLGARKIKVSPDARKESTPATSTISNRSNTGQDNSRRAFKTSPLNHWPDRQRAFSENLALATLANPPGNEHCTSPSQREGAIIGRVFGYSNTDLEGGNYRRLPFSKIVDALFYGQRMDDLLHRFTIRAEDGASRANPYSDVMVNVHGIVAGGMRIADNETVEVSGRYRDGVLMAKKIDVISGGGRTTVRFQRSVSAIMYAIIAAVIAVLAIYIGVEHGDVLTDNIAPFMTTWLICAVLIGGLHVGVLSKMGPLAQYFAVKHGKVPIVGVLLVSLLLALILLNSFGIGATVGSALEALAAAVIPIVVVGAIIVMIFKTLIHP